MRNLLLVIGALSLALSACGKDDGASAESCGPLTVTVDGEKIEGLEHGLAYKEKSTGGYLVQVFNHDETTCEEVLKGMRQVPEGEVAVRAFAQKGKSGSMASVGIGAHAELGVDVSVVSDTDKEGEPVSLCVKKAEFSPNVGPHKGKSVVISGLLEGSYCGAQK